MPVELPLETVSRVLALCAEAGVPVMLDPAPAAPLPDEIWRQVVWCTPNETEAAFYLGNESKPEDAAKQLLARGIKGVALKRGGDGAYVAIAGGKADWVRPFHVEAVDTVGAGDCFNGAFAVALLEGKDPWAAARFALGGCGHLRHPQGRTSFNAHKERSRRISGGTFVDFSAPRTELT